MRKIFCTRFYNIKGDCYKTYEKPYDPIYDHEGTTYGNGFRCVSYIRTERVEGRKVYTPQGGQQ